MWDPVLTRTPLVPRQSVHRAGDAQEQKLSRQFLIYGTRSTKDKSGAYLFLPDGEAKVWAGLAPVGAGVGRTSPG